MEGKRKRADSNRERKKFGKVAIISNIRFTCEGDIFSLQREGGGGSGIFELSKVYLVRYSDGEMGLSEIPKKVEEIDKILGLKLIP